LTAATLPPRIARDIDRGLDQATAVILEEVEAWRDRSGDGPQRSNTKGHVTCKVTITLVVEHALESGVTTITGATQVAQPKTRAKAAPVLLRDDCLMVEPHEAEQPRLPLDGPASDAAPRARLVR
jgi:hypothetical protein